MMKIKLALTAAVAVLVVVVLTLQHSALKQLREENLTLRRESVSVAALQAENERLSRIKLDSDELDRPRGEHLELLRLRGEIGRWRQNPPAETAELAEPSREADMAPMPSRMLLAPMKALVKDGETLVTGGWTTPEGRRGVVMVSPQIIANTGDSASQITVAFTLLEGAESAFAEAGLGDFLSHAGSIAAQHSFGADEAAALLQQLESTSAVDLLIAPRVSTLDGRQAQITIGDPTGTSISLNVIPRIELSHDGAAVEMNLFVVTETSSTSAGFAPAVAPLPVFTSPPSETNW